MAKIEVHPVTKVPNEYILTLSEDEAQALKLVLDNVGGDPETTPRGRIDSIYESLSAAKVHCVSWPIDGEINFKDSPDGW